MESKIFRFIDKIVDFKNLLKNKVHTIKENIKKTSIYRSKAGMFLRYIYNTICRSTVKHKYMIIPIIILIVAPVANSIILGSEFSKSPVNKIPTIIVNHDTSSTTQDLVQMIEDNDTFDVIIHSDRDEDIKKYINDGTVMAGVLIPENFSDDLLNGKDATIMTFYDGTFTSPTSSAKGAISEVLGTIKSGYLMKLAEGKIGLTPQNAKNLISPLGYNYRFLGNPAKNMSYFMVQGIVLTSLQVAVAVAGAFISEKKSYLKLIFKGIIISLLGSFSALICMYIQIKYFNFPYRGTLLGGILLTMLCVLGWTFFGVFINYSKKGDKLAAATSCSVISITMLLSGYTFPALAMPPIVTKIADYMPNSHFIIPLRDISLLGFTYENVLPHIIWLLKFVLLMFALVTLKFITNKLPKKEKIKKNNYDRIRKDSSEENTVESGVARQSENKTESKGVLI